jgi:hypothetical protein
MQQQGGLALAGAKISRRNAAYVVEMNAHRGVLVSKPMADKPQRLLAV